MSFLNDYSDDLKKNPDDVEDSVGKQEIPEPGLHHAILNGCREVTSKQNQTRGRELTFRIIAGPAKGLEVKDTLWLSENEKARSRGLIFAHRLGLLKKVTVDGSSRYESVPGKEDFTHCDGAQVFVDITHEEYEKKDKTKGYAAKLSFEGIVSCGDKRTAELPRVGEFVPDPEKPKRDRKPAPPSIDKQLDLDDL